MKALFNGTGVKIIYALRSVKFWAAVAIYLSLLIFYSYTGEIYQTRQGLYYLLHYALQMSSREFLLMACALPAAGLFAEEWCSGRFVSSYIRTKKTSYAFSIILSSFIIAALVCVFACTAYIGIFSITHPLTGDPADRYFIQTQRSLANGGLMLKEHFFAYYAVTILREACYMGIFTTFAVVISLVITNSYIAVVLPMILYIMIDLVPLPILICPRNIYGGINYILYELAFNNRDKNFSLIAMLYPFVFTGIILIFLAFISYFLIKRKYEKNSDLR